MIQDHLLLRRILLPLLFLLVMACGPCSMLSEDQPTPPRPIVISTEAASQLESRIEQNLGGEPGKQFILRMTDAEVTSLAAAELSKFGEATVENPQIWFTKGKIYVTGRLVGILPVDTDFTVVAAARVQDGKVHVEIEDVSAGALPIPESMLDAVSQSINETVNEMQLDVEVTALEILEGEVIVKGIRQ